MNPVTPQRADFAPDEIAGADVIGGVMLGGVISLGIWAALISVFLI